MTTPTGKTTAVSNSYPTHKTISFVEEKTIVNKDLPPVIAKEIVTQENKVVATVKTAMADIGKSSYPNHKTIDLGGNSQELKKDEPVKQTISNAINKLESVAPGLTNNDTFKKAADQLKDQPLVNKIDNTIQKASSLVKDNPVNQLRSLVQTDKSSYPNHKTIVLEGAAQEIKKEEPAKQTITGAFNKLESVAPGLTNNDTFKKAADQLKNQPVVNKVDDTLQKASNLVKDNPADKVSSFFQKTTEQLKEQTELPKIDTGIEQATNLVKDNPADKVSSFFQKTTDQLKEQTELPKIDTGIEQAANLVKDKPADQLNSLFQKTADQLKEQPVVQKIDATLQQTTNSIKDKVNSADKSLTSALDQITGKNSYPDHKTFTLEHAKGKQEVVNTVNTVRDELMPPVTSREPLTVASQNKQEQKKEEVAATVKTALPQGSYPSHKTHYFVKEEVTSTEQYTAPLVKPDSNESVSVEPKPAALKNAAAPIVQQPVSNKKPILWIAASAVLLLSSAGTAWYAYQQKKSMQEEISTLKQSNEVLAENVKKLQKELHIDDIIARAGKVDAKNNIVVATDVNASDVVRACFSITPNTTAKMGKKMVYVRLLTQAGTVLTSGTANVFDYKGEKIPYSSKAEINFIGREMMLCIDYKPAEKLQKGTYKAEIYNDGVLDGTSTFELK